MSEKSGSDFVTWDDLCKFFEGRGAIKGERGDRGEAGEMGDRGEKGEQGDRGEKGDKGHRGDEGRKGDKGDKGDQGCQGLKGEKGCAGDKGDRGDRGEKGERGETGCVGERGDRGVAGDKGEKGDRGETGDKGEKGETGEKGQQGDKGDKGEQGEKGDKGETGDTGPKGDPGETGDKGDTGAAGVAATDAQIQAAVNTYLAANGTGGGDGTTTNVTLTKEADPANPCRQRIVLVVDGQTQYMECYDPDKQCCVCACATISAESNTVQFIGSSTSGVMIDWGDGNTEEVAAGSLVTADHPYADAGEYKITVCLNEYCDTLSNWDITGGVNIDFASCQECD